MKYAHRCQLAELVTVGLHDAGVRPHTRPWVFTAQIFQPLFERNVPIQRRTRAERRQVPIIWVALLPLMLVGLVLVAPIEIWRWLRARQRNAQMMAQLPQPSETSVTYRNAPAHEAGDSTLIASASEVVCFDFRIEDQGRAVLLGAAVGLLHEGEPDVVWLDGHRRQPTNTAMDARSLAARLTAMCSNPPAVEHWVWQLSDPYELVDREQRPW